MRYSVRLRDGKWRSWDDICNARTTKIEKTMIANQNSAYFGSSNYNDRHEAAAWSDRTSVEQTRHAAAAASRTRMWLFGTYTWSVSYYDTIILEARQNLDTSNGRQIVAWCLVTVRRILQICRRTAKQPYSDIATTGQHWRKLPDNAPSKIETKSEPTERAAVSVSNVDDALKCILAP